MPPPNARGHAPSCLERRAREEGARSEDVWPPAARVERAIDSLDAANPGRRELRSLALGYLYPFRRLRSWRAG